jgi:hypothetical protein
VPSFSKHDLHALTAADRLRLIHDYITSAKQDGGLGIIPESSDWDLVESVMALHDRQFNEAWIRSWTTKQILSVKLGMIREQVRAHDQQILSIFLTRHDRRCSLVTLSLCISTSSLHILEHS